MDENPQVGPVNPDEITSDIKDVDGNVVHEGNAPEGTRSQCWYNGTAFSAGARICQEGKIKECDQWGSWSSTFDTC